MNRFTAPILLTFLAITLLSLLLSNVQAFVTKGVRWPSPTATFSVDIPGPHGFLNWNAEFATAMAKWGAADFDYQIKHEKEDPCDGGNGINGVGFREDICGDAFGAMVLAVMASRKQVSSATFLETNIIFNNKRLWQVYDGPYGDFPYFGYQDFRRVAVHELGHALGLGHEFDVPAIMAPSVSHITEPTDDDKAGVAAIYVDGYPNLTICCPNKPFRPSGWSDKIVVSRNIGSNTDSSNLTSDDTLYLDWTVYNNGVSPTASTYTVELYVDDLLTHGWQAPSPHKPGFYWGEEDFNLGKLGAGTHDIRIHFDSLNEITENNELDNEYTKTISVTSQLPARPTLLSPASRETEVSLNPMLSWSAASGATSYDVHFGPNINPPVVQNTTGTSFNPGPLIPNQTYYWWVAAKNSSGKTPSQYYRSFTTIAQTDSAARSSHVFPQMVDGVGWTSFLLATNPGREGTVCNFVPKGGLDASRLAQPGEFFLPPNGGSSLVFTKATESLAVGYGALDCTQPVTAQLTYIQQNGATVISMTTVPSSDSARAAQLQFLNFSGFRTAFAIANDSLAPISCEIALSHETIVLGNKVRVVQGTAFVVVEPKTNLARFADEIVSLDPTVGTGIVGIECSDSVQAVGLLFNGSSFSTAPVTILDQTDSTARAFHVFPQMVDGDLVWVSYLFATNPGPVGTTCTFTPSGGLDASRLAHPAEFFLAPLGGSTIIITNGTDSLAVGYATLDCTQPVTAQLTYIHTNGPDVISMATVPSSDSVRSARLQYLNFSGFRTAFAIANDSLAPISCEIALSHETIVLGNKVRVVQGTAFVVVEPKTNLARFADEIVSLDPAVGTGIVEIECNGSVHAVGLLFNGSSFSTAPVTILVPGEPPAVN